jgi:alpha-tubulin suppressor-like RCC1 family protein
MAKNPVGFAITDPVAGWNEADFDDVFIRKDCFLEGGLWGWGNNFYGRLGNNSIINRSSPVQTISGGTNWKSISLGRGVGGAAIKTDGSLWLWGDGTGGRLGNNSEIGRSSPVQTISGGTNWKSVSVGNSHAAAIKTDGSLWLWGRVDFGSGYTHGFLGDNSIINRSSPVQTISGGTNWKSVSTAESHTAAIKTDGTLWLWGYGIYGRLGNNSEISRSSPVQTISGGTNWKSVSTSKYNSAAIKTDGSLWLWGSASNGRLGDNSIINRSSPVQTISGGTNWKSVSTSIYHAAAIKTDGTLWSWGRGALGRLGNNLSGPAYSPVQTISGGANWKSLDVGYCGTAAIKTDGTLWLWGYGSYGRLGNNSEITRSSPVQTISGGTNWKSIQFGTEVAMAIREDCW